MRARTVMAGAPTLTGLCWSLCAWEIRRARQGPRPYVDPLDGTGAVSPELAGPVVRVAWLGDSLAAGLGCDVVDDTPARLSARLLERPVDLQVLAVPGARATDVLEQQVPRLDRGADLVVLCVGANDVAARAPRAEWAATVDTLLGRLAPTPVVMLGLPDMATADRLAQPLRSLAGLRARWFEAARAEVASRHDHVTSIDIATRPEGVNRRTARTLLCTDRFHPGAGGYRFWAERVAVGCDAVLSGRRVAGTGTV